MEIEESKIIRRCQSGQLEEFGKLYDAYVKKIYNFIYYRTHHQETAEDLTSQTFTRALESISRFDPGKGGLSAWLYRIARNLVIDHYRTFRPTVDIENVWDLSADSDLPRDIDTRDQLAKISDYLKTIDKQARDIVLMRVWDGLSYQEIAEIVGKSQAACKMTFSRTMQKLRAESIDLLILLLLYRIIVK